MLQRIAIATCAEADGARSSDLPLLAAFRESGCDVEHVEWNRKGVRWESFDACVVRSTWDWQYHVEEFRGWIDRAAGGCRVFNAPELLRWGLDKRYLLELERAGVPVVPTVAVPDDERRRIGDVCEERGWERIVIKPSLGATAYRTVLLDASDADVWARQHADWRGTAIVQEFLTSVRSFGETSVVCIGGEALHAVRKLPRKGDFRSQREFGGGTELVEIGGEERAVAERCLLALPAETTYARIDLIRDEQGCSRVIECEVVEPELYFELRPLAARRLADLVMLAPGA